MKQQQIEQLKNDESVLQFALPNGGCGFVTKNNELILSIGGKLNTYGHFEKSINDDDEYYFVYNTGFSDIPEEIHSLNKDLIKDLYAFAIILGYFFNKYPNYKGSRNHDWDVISSLNSSLNSSYNKIYIETPLYKAGFTVSYYDN